MIKRLLSGSLGFVLLAGLWLWVVSARQQTTGRVPPAPPPVVKQEVRAEPVVSPVLAVEPVATPEPNPQDMDPGVMEPFLSNDEDPEYQLIGSVGSRPAPAATPPVSARPVTLPVQPTMSARSASPTAAPAPVAKPAEETPEPAADSAVDEHVQTILDNSRSEEQRLAAIMDLRDGPESAVHPGDIEALADLLRNSAQSATLRRELALFLHDRKYKGLADVLMKILVDRGEGAGFRSFCVRLLGAVAANLQGDSRAAMLGQIRGLLDDRELPVRRESLRMLVRAGDSNGVAKAVEWLYDKKSEAVCDLAIHCVRELSLTGHVARVRQYLAESNAAVRIAAIVTLCQWNDAESFPDIEEASRTGDPQVRRAARLALARIKR